MAGKRRLPRAAGGANAANKKRRYDERAPLSSSPLYAASDDVLVLGDGDFSFSQGLASHRGTGAGVVATSFDSESRVKSKYPNAAECIAAVRRAGGLVLHSVDATKLHLLPRSAPAGEGKQQQKTKKKAVPAFFQYIVFNFPHSGQQRVHINRALLLDFFESARARLLARGEAHVTLKTRPPYSNWLVEDQAKAAGFVLKERRKFDARLFPGYRHRTTDPQAKKFEAELCVTYTFVVNRSKYPFDPNAVPSVEEDEAEERASTSDSSEGEQLITEAVVPPPAAAKRRKPVKSATLHAFASQPARFSPRHAESTVRDSSNRLCAWQPWTPLHRRARAIQRRLVVRANLQP